MFLSSFISFFYCQKETEGETVTDNDYPYFHSQRVKDEVQNRSLQCAHHRGGDTNALLFSKPPGHEQFYASLNAIRHTFSLPKQECRRDVPDMHNLTTTAVNHSIKHQCSGQKFLHDPVYDEAVEPLEGTQS